MKALEISVNNNLNNIILRIKEQCNITDRNTIDFLVLCIAGFRPRVIAYILGISDKTFYSKRDRLISKIKMTYANDVEEFITAIKPGKL